ncbi:MAG: tetratricopeptide repeat protein [Planctomycetota bacterium]
MAEDKDTTQQARITAESILEKAMDVQEDAPPAKAPMIKIDDAVDGVVDATQSGIKRRSVFRRIGVVAIAILLPLGIAGVLLFFQWHWFQAGTQVIVKMLDEKMRETIKKSLDETINKSAVKETPVDDDTSTDKHADKGASKNGEEAAPVDTSKFIIEANRIYEQGNYGRAATLYGKGMDKSASFKNEDFVVYRLGDCRFRTGKYEEALKTFQSLNSEYVNSPFRFKSLLKTGECYAAMGDLKKARKTLYTIIAQEGNCTEAEDKSIVADAYFKIADYYMEEGKQLRMKNADSIVTHTQSLAFK